jgi:hypothetical protein
MNKLTINLKDFKSGLKIFKAKPPRANAKKKEHLPAVISFSDGFMSIDCDEKVTVMRAVGEWSGKAHFSYSIVHAMALVPPNNDPMTISYNDGKLTIGSTSVSCDWVSVSHHLMDKLANPTLIDIFAMWRSNPAHDVHKKEINKQIVSAKEKMLRATANSATRLKEFEVTQDELLALIESKINARINEGN